GDAQRGLGVVAEQASELPQTGDGLSARRATTQLGDPVGKLGQLSDQLSLLEAELLVAATLALAALGLGKACALGAVYATRVSGDEARTIEELELGLGLAHLEASTDEAWGDLIAEGVDVDVAFEVDDAMVK